MRKTGPCHHLSHFYCRKHSITFTVYPEKYIPFSRAEVWPDLEALLIQQEPFKKSYFQAAIDAAEGKKWPIFSTEGPTVTEMTFLTQKRYLKGILELFGINPNTSQKEFEKISSISQIPTLELIEAKSRDGPEANYKDKGKLILKLTDRIKKVASGLEKILNLCDLAKFCGPHLKADFFL